MKTLILGGYRFLGRAVIDAALQRGDRVTMFNRGATAALAPADVERLIGDRTQDVAQLAGRSWDIVVDTSGYAPAAVARSAAAVAATASRYVFVSTLSVYPWPVAHGTSEDAAVEPMPAGRDPNDDKDLETYGARKALCERAAEAAMPGRVLHARAGMIVGPYDYLDRFAYWVERASAGKPFIGPGKPDRAVQLVDARDLAHWMISTEATGAFNATGPARPHTMQHVIEACQAASGVHAPVVWMPDEFLERNDVVEDRDLPYWLKEPENGLLDVNVRRAHVDGLRLRPLVESAKDVLEWTAARPTAARNRGLDPARERELLDTWRRMHGT